MVAGFAVSIQAVRIQQTQDHSPPPNAAALAFEEAFDEGFRATVHFLRSRGIGPDLAEELAQAAWTKGWQCRSQLRDPGSLGAWVNSIAFNMLRRHMRHPSNHTQELFEREAEAVDMPLHMDLEFAFRLCNESDSRMLRMFYLEGMTSKEIGSALGQKAMTVRVRLHRLRKSLRRSLAHVPTKRPGIRQQRAA